MSLKEEFYTQPYLMQNPVQPYAWGAKGERALIPKLIGIEPQEQRPYAELWMGAHPNAPSKIFTHGEWIDLDKAISKAPDFFLGEKLVLKFGTKLPYLFKVLSAEEVLSIQVHPDKEHAQWLHYNDPDNYPDTNHKPELAYVLDRLELLSGFQSVDKIYRRIKEHSELQIIFPQYNAWNRSSDIEFLKSFWEVSLKRFKESPQDVDIQLRKLYQKLKKMEKEAIDQNVNIFIEQAEKYSQPDIGLLFCLFMEYMDLKSGQAIYLPPKGLHSYIKGNIIECMANSDNVIRAGLTYKRIDLEALAMVGDPLIKAQIVEPVVGNDIFHYKIPFPDFSLKRIILDNSNYQIEIEGAQIVLLWEGSAKLQYNNSEMKMVKGKSYFLPARMGKVKIIPDKRIELFIISSEIS